jgi:trimeric autotransporter adhesin
LYSNSTGLYNTAVGGNALTLNTTGGSNIAMGVNALGENTTGGANVGLGNGALFYNTTASYNTAIGGSALTYNTTGANNVAIGYNTLYNNSTGLYNTATGAQALGSNTIANYNTANGYFALFSNTGNNNTAFGANALATNTTGSNNTTIGYAADVTTGNLSNATAIGYNAKVSQSNSLILGSAVNVGIGTTAPNARLEIDNTTTGTSGLRFTRLLSTSTPSTANNVALSVNPTGDVILVPSTSLWSPATVGTNNIINNNAGAVIIGSGVLTTPNPTSYSLYVSKGILTEKVKIALINPGTNWADYVFNKDYKLQSLDSVENYINTNKHLPDVPSADELVKDGGIDVNQMFAKQMEKTEELTLYIIQQNKKIDELEKRVDELEKEKSR